MLFMKSCQENFFDKIVIICYHYNNYMKNPKKLRKIEKKSAVRNTAKVKNTKEPDAITKITFYLAVSDIAQNAKESWAGLLPYMSERQLQRLAPILWGRFLDAPT